MPAIAQIIITLDDQGQISVAAPFVNKMLCYGLLELARDVVRDEHQKTQQPRTIQPASLGDLAQIRKGGS